MPFTDQGYDTRRFNEILEEIRSNLETLLGTPITSDPDTVFGILNSIWSNQLAVSEANIQALSNSLDIYKAEGIYLDKLVRYIGIERLSAQPAKGQLKVWRNTTGTINTAVLFQNTTGEQFSAIDGLVHETSACSELILTPTTVSDGKTYSFTIDGLNLSYTAAALDTATEVVDYFVTQVTNLLGYTTSNETDTFKVSIPDTDINSLSVTNITNFNTTSIATFNSAESVQVGFLQVPLNTITATVNAVSGVTQVNNPLDWVDGRDLETDEELKARYKKSVAQAGSATLDSIRAALLQLPNVTDVFIRENITYVTDANGLPPKSYECIVINGDPQNIADEIWETKPAGIETHGSINTSVTDDYNNPQTVNWSRPTEIYIWVEATYSIYDEETFPSNGDALIKEAILEYGQSLSLGNDIIPTRFIGNIYSKVSGIDSLSIRIGQSDDVNDVTPDGGYVTTRIPISNLELPLFTLAKTVTLAT